MRLKLETLASDAKSAGTTGTTGTPSKYKGSSCPSTGETRWDMLGQPPHAMGAQPDLSQLSQNDDALLGHAKPSIYAAVPVVPVVPAENGKTAGELTEAAHRCWLIDGREAVYSPPVSEAALRRWYPVATLSPTPDDRRPPAEATGDDAKDWALMVEAVRLALRGLAIDVERVLAELTGDELQDWRAGHFGPAEIAAFARSVTSRGEP